MIKPKTRQEIANELGMSYSTFRRWVKKSEIKLSRGLLFPADQKIIYDTFYSNVDRLSTRV